jgi:A/G-specific adenine glycosylase
MTLSPAQISEFQTFIWQYYAEAGRHDLPWRLPEPDGSYSAYKVMVSELMLQQTQVSRVVPKFNQFLGLFPMIEALAGSSLAAVLTAWSGLGYNRRAKYLHQAAKIVVQDMAGTVPSEVQELVRLPGIGTNTAGAILAYAYNRPVIFVETNIRTVMFNHFLQGRGDISDREVTDLVAQTLDTKQPRLWYWALMDYGAHLKATGMKLNTLSKHYTKQSAFHGSKRQIRGQIIRALTGTDHSLPELAGLIPDARLAGVLNDLLAEQLIRETSGR